MGEPDAIRLLLEYGASLHAETRAGVTPLVAAVREGRLQVRANEDTETALIEVEIDDSLSGPSLSSHTKKSSRGW